MKSEHVRVLTLLSNFGDRDTYVGVMKGVSRFAPSQKSKAKSKTP